MSARTGYGHMVLDDCVERLRQIRRQRRERLEAIRTRADALAYQRRVRRAIGRACGPRPGRTPLNTRVTGVVERRHYRIEKLLFESRPGCLVSAHLYLPNGLTGAAPGVLGTCGHSEAGKLEPLYQGFCQRLVRSGFVVLILDPFSQGERDQYWHLGERRAVANCCHAHNTMGKQLELLGEWFGMWRAWDGIRALDVLLSRPEVDPARVGVTGNSGGGTLTTWLWALERRFTMAAPSCFVTTFLANLENEIPADCEQYPPGAVGAGLEMADFLIARAPEPVILLGQEHCYFDRRGLREAYAEVRRFYDLLGAPEPAARLFLGPNPHGFSVHNQEAMVDFFCLHAQRRPVRLRRTQVLPADAGWVTPQGSVVAAEATPIYELIAARAGQLRAARRPLGRAQLVARTRDLLHLPARSGVPHYRILRGVTVADRGRVARYAVETGGGIRAILYKRVVDASRSHTLDVERQVRLFLPHLACAEELAGDGLAAALARAGALYLLDPRGLGESRPDEDEGADFFHPYGMDYLLHGHELLLGESYLGKRVHDVLATLDLLAASGARQVRLFGRGQGAVIGLFAALLHGAVTAVTLQNAPLSFHGMTQTPLPAWPVAGFPRGVLRHFDLPDLYRALGRRLTLLQPWDEGMAPLRGARLRAALAAAGIAAGRVQA